MRLICICVMATLSGLSAACGDSQATPDAAVGSDAAPSFDSGSMVVDAAASDAPSFDAAFEIGVRCGEAQELCDPVLTAGCCTTVDGASSCQPVGKTTCSNGELTSCDGVEDCMNPGDDACCSFGGHGPSCTIKDDCNAGLGGTIICHHDSECSAEVAHCCAGQCTAEICQ
jgi:hypothetical protein